MCVSHIRCGRNESIPQMGDCSMRAPLQSILAKLEPENHEINAAAEPGKTGLPLEPTECKGTRGAGKHSSANGDKAMGAAAEPGSRQAYPPSSQSAKELEGR